MTSQSTPAKDGSQVKATRPPILRATPVNTGTSIRREDLPWPSDTGRRVMKLGRTHAEVDERSTVTAYGGLDLAAQLARRLKAAQAIDEKVKVLKLHLPYHESDHVLAQAFNLYSGGTCIEDLAHLQQSEAVRRILGACRIPDPTTAGDFLRRFEETQNPGSLRSLRQAGDAIQEEAWRVMARKQEKRGQRPATSWVFVDLDGKIKEVYGVQKEGADFSSNGKWSLHPLLVTLAEQQEILALRLQSGNERSSTGAAEALDEVLPRVKARFAPWILVRGDADFDRADVRGACEGQGVFFAFTAKELSNRLEIAESLAEEAWEPFQTRQEHHAKERAARPGFRSRRKGRNLRRERAARRGYKELRQTRQWIAEVPFKPGGSERSYRLIVRRKETEHHQGQQFLFDEYRYSYVLTNLPAEMPAADVVHATYRRCDQENAIEQLGLGIAGWRLPVGELAGNCAWLEIARLAWNMGKWLAQLALWPEVVRWEWKRFRHAFVTVPAQVIRRGRQIWVRLSGSHRFAEALLGAGSRLRS